MGIEQIANLVVLGLAGLLILLPVIWGLIRGWKKGLFRFVWCFITALILLFVSYFIAKWAITFDLTKFGQTINGYKTLQDFCVAKLQEIEQVKELMTYSPTLKDFIVLIPVLLINSILFTLLYWILKWLLWPIWAILSKIFIKKYKVRYENGKKIKTKKKRGRLLGALTGLGLGYLTCVVTFTPIIGISNFANDMDKKYKMEDGKGVVTSALDDMAEGTSQYLTIYENSTAKKVLRYTGIHGLSSLLFGQLSTSQEKDNISLTDEADRIVGVYVDVNTISKFNSNTLTQPELDKMLGAVRNIINSVFDSKLVKPLVDEIVPNLVTSLVEGKSTIMTLPTLEQPVFNQALIDSIKTLQNMDSEMFKHELLAVMDIIDVFNKEEMLLPMLTSGDKVDVPLMISWASETFSKDLATAFFKLDHVMSITPILLNAVIEYGCDTLGATFDKATINMDKIKDCFEGIIQTVVLACQDYETKPKYYFSTTTFAQLGESIDSLLQSDILTEDTKNSLIQKTKDKLVELYQEMKLPEELNQFVAEFSQSVLTLDEFKREMTIFGEIYQSIWANTNGKPFDKEVYNELGLIHIGHWLDLLTQSTIYDNAVTSFLDYGIDYALTFIPQDMQSLKQPMKDLVGNFKVVHNKAKEENTEITETKGVWKEELTKLQEFYNQMQVVVPLLDNLETNLTQSTMLNQIGIAFDDLLGSNSLLIKRENINALFSAVLDYVELPQDISSIMVGDKTIVEQLKANIDTIDGVQKTWVNEMAILKDLLTTDFTIEDTNGNYHLDTIGVTLDRLKGSSLFGNMVDAILEHFISVVQQDYSQSTEALDLVIADVLQGMKENLAQVDSYENEMKSLNKVFTSLNELTLETAGTLLDELAGTKLLGNQINKVLSYYIEEYTKTLDAEYQPVITSVKQNLTNLKQGDYEKEITYVLSISNFLSQSSFTKEDLDSLINSMLDENGNSKSKIITNEVIQKIIDVTFDMVMTASLGEYANNELVSVIKDNIANVENITNLLGAVDVLQDVATSLLDSVKSVEDITNNQDTILTSIETLYTNDVVNEEGTKVVTEITLGLIEQSIAADATIEESKKQEIMQTILQSKEDISTSSTLEDLQNSLSQVIQLLPTTI